MSGPWARSTGALQRQETPQRRDLLLAQNRGLLIREWFYALVTSQS
jgi:hypothetical protein